MSRTAEIETLNDRIESIGLSRAERRAIIDVLIDGKTHRETGNRDASRKRMQRARQKARAHGISIPAPRASLTPITAAQLSARAS
jgi:hypothetical protein